ncbi:unnamed protein product [Periconia digitata]|uniref:Uncharacterized protein n=1 Tax=Periconia digitata TaxID=1303443 RepID=A0A9W4UTX4_9PLEO|nr:unnamed protein product [Periconia digitata]
MLFSILFYLNYHFRRPDGYVSHRGRKSHSHRSIIASRCSSTAKRAAWNCDD